MSADKYTVTIGNIKKEYPRGSSYADVAADFKSDYDEDIALVYADDKLQELFKKLKKDCKVSFVMTGDEIGMQAYRRSVTFLMLKAIYDIADVKDIGRVVVEHSISKGYYCQIKGALKPDEAFLEKVKDRMLVLADEDIPIMKRSVSVEEAIQIFHDHGMYDKEKLFNYRQSSKVNIYSINEFEDYFYGYMIKSTGILRYFELYPYDTGFVLQLPLASDPRVVPPFEPQAKLFQVFREATNWDAMMRIETVGDLNDEITAGKANDLVLVQEALQEKRIGDIAAKIAGVSSKKFVLIAGPSSSSKTSFANRLSIQLRTHGLRPRLISVDNYFLERERTPKDKNGNYDFECLGALDIEKLNKDLTDLLNGQEVQMPTYNFVKGRQEYNGDKIHMGSNDILVIEGIHCLNDALTYRLSADNKFKIYISALTQLNIDEHNRIPTTDGRLIRRMIRDARTRGISAEQTIRMWPSVRRGEERNIFPYQEDADEMFNSALIYELAVLKQYCEPLLFGVSKGTPEYQEAKRLLKFLDYFVGFGSDNLPKNSLLREFIGGSCFNV